MRHDAGALVIAATLAAISVGLFAFTHPYPQSVWVLLAGLAGALAVWIVAQWKE